MLWAAYILFYQLGKLDLSSQDDLTLQNWLIEMMEVTSYLEEIYRMLEAELPADIRAIYLSENSI